MIDKLTVTICHGRTLTQISFILSRTTFLCGAVLILAALQHTFTVLLILFDKFRLDGGGVDALVMEEPLNLVGYVHVIIWGAACDMGRC